MSLGSAFLAAGVDNVVARLWPIDRLATAVLFDDFVACMQTAQPSLAPCALLRWRCERCQAFQGRVAGSLPSNVETCDIVGSETPEYVKIDGIVLPYTPPAGAVVGTVRAFFGGPLAALIAAGALIYTTVISGRRSVDLERRVEALEKRLGQLGLGPPARLVCLRSPALLRNGEPDLGRPRTDRRPTVSSSRL